MVAVSTATSEGGATPGSIATETGVPAPVVGDAVPTDPDQDGAYEDVNGDGLVTVTDADALLSNLETVPASAFDYTNDSEVTRADAKLLFMSTATGALDDDVDADGLPTPFEKTVVGTSPRNPDSDARSTPVNESGDGVLDGRTDFDGDGLHATAEYNTGTDPLAADTDGDGLGDAVEARLSGLDPTVADTDGDGITDGAADADGDGLSNRAEVANGTALFRADTDRDGLDDDTEAGLGTDPTRPDTDGDGLDDESERRLGTNPLVADTDDDGTLDGSETFMTTADDPETGVTVTVVGTGDVAERTTIRNATASFGNGTAVVTRMTAGPVVDVTPGADIESARVTVPYDRGADTGDLTLARFNETLGWFVPVESTVHLGNRTVTGTVEHFSKVTVVDTEAINDTVGSGLTTDPGTPNGTIVRDFENGTAPLLGTDPPTKRLVETSVVGGKALVLDGGYGSGVGVDGSFAVNLTRNFTVDVLVRPNASRDGLFGLAIVPGPDGGGDPSVLASFDQNETFLTVDEGSRDVSVTSPTATRWYRLQLVSQHRNGETTLKLRRAPADGSLGGWDATVTSESFGRALEGGESARITLSSTGAATAVGAYRVKTGTALNVTVGRNGAANGTGIGFEDGLDESRWNTSGPVSVTSSVALEGNRSVVLRGGSSLTFLEKRARLFSESFEGYNLSLAYRPRNSSVSFADNLLLHGFGVVDSVGSVAYTSRWEIIYGDEYNPVGRRAAPASKTWYRVRIRVRNRSDGIYRKVKLWRASADEPRAWDFTWNTSTIPATPSADSGRVNLDTAGFTAHFDDVEFEVLGRPSDPDENTTVSDNPFRDAGRNITPDSDIDDDGLPNDLEKRGIPVSPYTALRIHNPGADSNAMDVTGLDNWTRPSALVEGAPLPRIHTSPYAADTDGDGISDPQELGEKTTAPFTNATYYTLDSDPTDDNTDDIGLDDAAERAEGTDPLQRENMTVWFTVPTKAKGPDDPTPETNREGEYVLSPVSVHTPDPTRGNPTWLTQAYEQTGQSVPDGGTFLLVDVPVYMAGGEGTNGELPGGATFSITGNAGAVIAQGIRAGNAENDAVTRGRWQDPDTQHVAVSEGVTIVSLVIGIPQTPKASFRQSRTATEYARSWKQGNEASGATVSRSLGHISMTLANPTGDTEFYRDNNSGTPTTTLTTKRSYTVQYFGGSDAIRMYEKAMDRVRNTAINSLTLQIGTLAGGASEAAMSFGMLTRSGLLFYGGLAAAGANVYRGVKTDLTIASFVEGEDPEAPGSTDTIPSFQTQTGTGLREVRMRDIRSESVNTRTRHLGGTPITLHYTHTGAMLVRFS
ncbi:MAG: hypothetical protein ABEH88_07455 [Halobacteriales archaeon]